MLKILYLSVIKMIFWMHFWDCFCTERNRQIVWRMFWILWICINTRNGRIHKELCVLDQEIYPFRIADISIPEDSTGYVYMIVSLQAHINFMYIAKRRNNLKKAWEQITQITDQQHCMVFMSNNSMWELYWRER